MKRLASLVFALGLSFGPALGTAGGLTFVTVGGEFPTPGNTLGCIEGYNCVRVPPGYWIHGFTLTSTSKLSGLEVLAFLTCDLSLNGTYILQNLWQGEHFQGTLNPVVMLPKPVQIWPGGTPHCLVQVYTLGPSSAAGYEMQATLYLTETNP